MEENDMESEDCQCGELWDRENLTWQRGYPLSNRCGLCDYPLYRVSAICKMPGIFRAMFY